MAVQIIQGDALTELRKLPAGSVHCCVTSPPYWGLRDYGISGRVWGDNDDCEHDWVDQTKKQGGTYKGKSRWQHNVNGRGEEQPGERRQRLGLIDGHPEIPAGTICGKCGAWFGALGLEPTPELYCEHTTLLFREVRRVLRDDGTLWLNLGDSYYGSWQNYGGGDRGAGKQRPILKGSSAQNPVWEGLEGWRPPASLPHSLLKPKDLVGIPWMAAFALRADGWYLRQDIIWSKPNPMPESVEDRCTKSHEYIFLLSKSQRYYYNQEAILEPVSENTHARLAQDVEKQIGSERAHAGGKTNGRMKAVGRLPGNKTHKGTTAYEDGDERHRTKAGLGKYAEKMRKLAAAGSGIKNNESFDAACCLRVNERNKRSVWTVTTQPYKAAHFATFPPKLITPCVLAGCPEGGTVLDPFLGSGTTALVAQRNGCNCIGIELNPEYVKLAKRRISQRVLL